MVSRVLGGLILTGSLIVGLVGMAGATPTTASRVPLPSHSAPEFPPGALAGGIAILVGGVLVLNERRRKRSH
jgi:hypothetical protein